MRMIVSSGDLLRAVVDDVLDYSKLTTGNIDVEVKRSNLQQTLGSVVHSVEMRGLVTDVTIQTRYDRQIPEFVKTDTRRVQQILVSRKTYEASVASSNHIVPQIRYFNCDSIICLAMRSSLADLVVPWILIFPSRNRVSTQKHTHLH